MNVTTLYLLVDTEFEQKPSVSFLASSLSQILLSPSKTVSFAHGHFHFRLFDFDFVGPRDLEEEEEGTRSSSKLQPCGLEVVADKLRVDFEGPNPAGRAALPASGKSGVESTLSR
jgi:hypothetical protein